MAVHDQLSHFTQRILAAASRPKAVARWPEPRLEDRFEHELHRRLDDAVLDRGNAQWSRPAIALGDVNAPDRLRPVGAGPQCRRKLGQIQILPSLEPLDALPIYACRALVGPNSFPGRFERCRRPHLVDQTEPTIAFDAVFQRRHHAVGPDAGFHPRPVAGFCSLCSPRGHCRRFPCLLPHFPHPPSCPAFPRRGFALRASRGLRRCGTMRALTPAARSHTRQVSPFTPLRLPSIPPPTTSCARASLCQSPQRAQPALADQASPGMSRLAASRRRIGFVILRAALSLPAALHLASLRRSCLRLHEM